MSAETPGAGLDATLRDFTGGQKVFSRYALIKILGRGGMGIVWLAHDELLDRDVALKFLPEIIIHDRAVLEDLKRETKRSLELTHANIIRIHDFVHDVVSGCISMEYVEGDTLSNLRADKPAKAFEPDEVKPWLRQLCEALDYAHNSARIIHRDLKPANLMISKRGQLKVADFGIARSLSDSVSLITHTQGTSGTLVYMSPQQLDGERGTHLDDIYSLGATIYELLTSKPPFYSGDVGRQIHDRIPPTMSQRRSDLDIEGRPIPKNWEETVAACLAKDPAKRPQSVTEVANRLGLASPKIDTVVQPSAKATKSRKMLVAAAALCLATAVGWYFGIRGPGEKVSKETQVPMTSPASNEAVATRHPEIPPIKSAVSAEPKVTPAFSTASQVVIFAYHRFVNSIRYPATEITPIAFESQMKQLRDSGITVISLQDFLAWRRREKNIPLSSAVITFDDSWKSQYEVGWPILKKYGYPLTMFVYTEGVRGGRLGGGEAITWEQLAEMRDGGVDIEAHSATHEDLREGQPIMWVLGRERTKTKLTGAEYERWLENEVVGCKQTIEQRLNIRVNCFAVPFGLYNDHVKEVARNAGYEAMFTVYGAPVTFNTPLDSCGRYAMEANKPELLARAVENIRVH